MFLLFIPRLYGFDLSVTGTELGFDVKPEFNQTFHQCWTFSALGSLEINEKYSVRSGFARWQTEAVYEVDTFVNGGVDLLSTVDRHFSVNLAYIYNGLPAYKTYNHTALPTVSIKGQRAGFSLGAAFRFSSFFGEPVIFESILAFSGYVNFYTTEAVQIGLRCGNFNDFSARNMGAYLLNLYSRVHITKSIFLINEVELYQSGSGGLSAAFYGIAYRGGIVFSW